MIIPIDTKRGRIREKGKIIQTLVIVKYLVLLFVCSGFGVECSKWTLLRALGSTRVCDQWVGNVLFLSFFSVNLNTKVSEINAQVVN